jgi:class 3 adenylate cyclase/HAMP domain-containing protein
MSLKRLLLLFACISLPLAGTITFTAVLLNETTQKVEVAENRRFTSYILAEELLRSSEMLTRFARTYVATGDIRFRNYYNQLLDIRNGKIPTPENYSPVYWNLLADSLVAPPVMSGEGVSLDERMQEAGITLREFALLKDAQNLSNDLVRLEDEAMNSVQALIAKSDPQWLTHPDRIRAIEQLHGRSYHHFKAAIMQPIGKFLVLLQQRSDEESTVLNQQADHLLLLLVISSAIMLLCFIGFAFLLYRQLLVRGRKLMDSVQAITEGHLETRINDQRNDELGRLSVAIDGMTAQLAGALTATEKKLSESEAFAESISEQKEHSEKLLHNILPVLIADRLKKGEAQIAETFPEVTVLFADIVGFTQMSTTMAPRQLVNMLNDIFGRFDELAEQFNLEKIKTIGDCYMVVGGVPDRSPTHCQQVAEFALAAIEAIRKYSRDNGYDLHIRIGVHTGTVVAGVVGKRKYSYDLWGDVVNTASRMESSGQPDVIHVTEAVKIRLSDDYNFKSLGSVDLKGKGLVESHILLSKKVNRD